MTRLLIVLTSLTLILAGCGLGQTGSAGPITVDSAATPPPTMQDSVSGTDATGVAPTTTTATTTTTRDDTGAPSTSAAPPTTTPASEPDETPPDTTDPTITVEVFFLSDTEAIPVTRTYTGREPATAAMQALLAGPSSEEASSGLNSAVPPGTLLLGLSISGGVADVDLSGEFESGGGSFNILGRLVQVVYTLTQFPTVDEVRFLLDGKPVDSFSGEGVVLDGPVGRNDYLSAVPIGDGHETTTPVWGQDDLPAVTIGTSDVYRVVLVVDGDSLNVRSGAGTENPVMGSLLPGTAIRVTGNTAPVDGGTWLEVESPLGPGWVNGFYLTGTADPVDGAAMGSMVNELGQRFQSGSEFDDLISEKGLFVAHHATPIRVRSVEGLLTDPTTYRWGSNALEEDSPEIQPETFSEAVAATFVSTTLDDDTQILIDEAIEGPNGRPVDYAIPTELGGFPFVTVHDAGDDAAYGGLDWMTWYVSFSIEDGRYRIVGLTIDEWAP